MPNRYYLSYSHDIHNPKHIYKRILLTKHNSNKIGKKLKTVIKWRYVGKNVPVLADIVDSEANRFVLDWLI